MKNSSGYSTLRQRFPQVFKSTEFLTWIEVNRNWRWYESYSDDDHLAQVILRSVDTMSVFALQLDRWKSRDGKKIVKEVMFDGRAAEKQQFEALRFDKNALRDGSERIIAVRPVVDFGKPDPVLGWSIEKVTGEIIEQLSYFNSLGNSMKMARDMSLPVASEDWEPSTSSSGDDSLASNECHHLEYWYDLAVEIAAGSTNYTEIAQEIFNYLAQTMIYDEFILRITEFTHSDNLTLKIYDWKGVCDEWAVAQITLLRSLGIPAKLIHLSWFNNGRSEAHSCCEWFDGERWVHMDALWNAFDNPEIYRSSGVDSVLVMDASCPLDSRSSASAWGVSDPIGDQQFHPYEDFLMNPEYPGEIRAGYSF